MPRRFNYVELRSVRIDTQNQVGLLHSQIESQKKPRVGENMPDLRLYIPKALVFQRLVKSAISAANNIDQGTEINDAHAFALLEFFEFLAPEQLTPLMGPGLAAEISAIIESEFSWAALSERTPVQNLLCTQPGSPQR
jgi:hypothetical protein